MKQTTLLAFLAFLTACVRGGGRYIMLEENLTVSTLSPGDFDIWTIPATSFLETTDWIVMYAVRTTPLNFSGDYNNSLLKYCAVPAETRCETRGNFVTASNWLEVEDPTRDLIINITVTSPRGVIGYAVMWCFQDYLSCTIPCPEGCNWNGACDIETQKCTCDPWLPNAEPNTCASFIPSDPHDLSDRTFWIMFIIFIIGIMLIGVLIFVVCSCIAFCVWLGSRSRHGHPNNAPSVGGIPMQVLPPASVYSVVPVPTPAPAPRVTAPAPAPAPAPVAAIVPPTQAASQQPFEDSAIIPASRDESSEVSIYPDPR